MESSTATAAAESRAQQELGLSNDEYRRWLFITRDIAKDLLREMAKEKVRDKYSWTQVPLPKKEEIKAQVAATLLEEGIPIIAPEKISQRFQKVIKDIQRTYKNRPTKMNDVATSNVEAEKNRPYDPIRDCYPDE